MTEDERIALFTRQCREERLKITPQRLEIFREMNGAKDHPSAHMLHQRLQERMPTISLDTVYRTLLTFEQYGLITRVNTRESLARFDAKMEPHQHIICEVCHTIEDVRCIVFDALPLSEEIAGWGKIHAVHAVIYGICKRCLEKASHVNNL